MFNNNTSTGLCCLMERKCSVKCVLRQPSRFFEHHTVYLHKPKPYSLLRATTTYIR